MPLFVVTDQPHLEALAASVLRPRASQALRTSAIEAIRAANPTVDLAELRPGMIVRIPTLEGARTPAAGDAVDPGDDLVTRAGSDLSALLAATEQAVAVAEEERSAARRVFSSAEVKRLADSMPELRAAIDAWQATSKEDTASQKEQLNVLQSSVEHWREEIAQLQALLTD